jgi:hypothetical protein
LASFRRPEKLPRTSTCIVIDKSSDFRHVSTCGVSHKCLPAFRTTIGLLQVMFKVELVVYGSLPPLICFTALAADTVSD